MGLGPGQQKKRHGQRHRQIKEVNCSASEPGIKAPLLDRAKNRMGKGRYERKDHCGLRACGRAFDGDHQIP